MVRVRCFDELKGLLKFIKMATFYIQLIIFPFQWKIYLYADSNTSEVTKLLRCGCKYSLNTNHHERRARQIWLLHDELFYTKYHMTRKERVQLTSCNTLQ